MLYVKKVEICPAYISKHNSNRKKQNHSFDDSEQGRMALSRNKKLSTLLREIISKNSGDFYCKQNSNHIKKVCENNFFCDVAMPFEDTNTLIN